MSRTEWGALVVVLVAVLGLQLVGHRSGGDHHTDGHSHAREAPERPTSDSPESRPREGMFRTVTLEVRGMT